MSERSKCTRVTTLHLANARLIDPEAGTGTVGALTLHDGMIVALNGPAPKRATEIDCGGHALADDLRRSVIQEQVEMGVAVRMACMDLLARNLRAERGRAAVGVMA